METKNAKITSTMLGIEDHGIFSFMLHLDYGGSGQGAGGYALDAPIDKDGVFLGRVGTASGMSLIIEILKIVGVDKWEDLKGKLIRVKAEQHKVYAVGHYLNDKWLDFEVFWKEIKPLVASIEE